MFSRCLLLGLLFLPTACTQQLFEHDTRQSYALDHPASDPRLMDIQFFVSERIVLRREQNSRTNKLTAGRVLHRKDRRVDEIVIPAGTPGVAFSRNTELVFEHRETSSDDADPRELYVLRHDTDEDGRRLVHVGKRTYRVDRRGAKAKLMFAQWSLTRLHKRRRILSGRRI